nr:hypothetical protein GCM10020092_023510 [Actinoplanes digitatis]
MREIAEWAWGLTGGRGVVTTTETAADSAATGPIPTTEYSGFTERDLGVSGERAHADRWVWEARYVKLLLVIDFGATLIATLAAFVLRFQGAPYADWYLVLSALIPPVWVGLLAITHAYERRVLFMGGEEYQLVLRAGVRLTLGIALASYVANADLARGYLSIALVLTTVLSLAEPLRAAQGAAPGSLGAAPACTGCWCSATPRPSRR